MGGFFHDARSSDSELADVDMEDMEGGWRTAVCDLLCRLDHHLQWLLVISRAISIPDSAAGCESTPQHKCRMIDWEDWDAKASTLKRP